MGFVSAGVLVYGTGYYYPPVVIPGPVPVFYPYPHTYAGSVWYNPSSGAWARGGTATGGGYYNPATGGGARAGAIYGPYGGAGAWSYYNPRTGTYSRGSAVWGGGSGTAHASFYNSRYGISGSTTQNANPYARWGSSTVTGPNNTVNTASGRNANGAAGGFSSSSGAAGAGYHNRATGNSGGAVRTSGGDVYAGRDGNVYRHTDSGWSKWDNGGWNTGKPALTVVGPRSLARLAREETGAKRWTDPAISNWSRIGSVGNSVRSSHLEAASAPARLAAAGASAANYTRQRHSNDGISHSHRIPDAALVRHRRGAAADIGTDERRAAILQR